MPDIVLQENYPYPPARIWELLTDSSQLARWLMPNDFVAEPGREFTMTASPLPGFDGVVHGKVLELDPLQRMHWAWASGAVSTTLSFELTPVEAGTRLTIEHGEFEGLPMMLRLLLKSGAWKRELQRRLEAALQQPA